MPVEHGASKTALITDAVLRRWNDAGLRQWNDASCSKVLTFSQEYHRPHSFYKSSLRASCLNNNRIVFSNVDEFCLWWIWFILPILLSSLLFSLSRTELIIAGVVVERAGICIRTGPVLPDPVGIISQVLFIFTELHFLEITRSLWVACWGRVCEKQGRI